MKSYLLSHGEACTPEHVQRVLNDTRAVETWVTPFPYAAILISRLDVRDLAAVIRERLPGVWLMVTELNGGAVQGWLPADLWEYVNDPSKARSRKLFSGAAPPTTRFTVPGLHDSGSIARDEAVARWACDVADVEGFVEVHDPLDLERVRERRAELDRALGPERGPLDELHRVAARIRRPLPFAGSSESGRPAGRLAAAG